MNFFLRLRQISRIILGCGILFLTTACNKTREHSFSDHPRLTSKVELHDVAFHASALDRDVTYRVVPPVNIPPGSRLPVVYLLHGGNGSFRDWSNNTDVLRFAERGLILVMPDGDESWYTNSAERARDR